MILQDFQRGRLPYFVSPTPQTENETVTRGDNKELKENEHSIKGKKDSVSAQDQSKFKTPFVQQNFDELNVTPIFHGKDSGPCTEKETFKTVDDLIFSNPPDTFSGEESTDVKANSHDISKNDTGSLLKEGTIANTSYFDFAQEKAKKLDRFAIKEDQVCAYEENDLDDEKITEETEKSSDTKADINDTSRGEISESELLEELTEEERKFLGFDHSSDAEEQPSTSEGFNFPDGKRLLWSIVLIC